MLPKISVEFLKSIDACKSGIQAYIECGKPANLLDVLDVCKTNKNVSYGAWLITKLLNKQNNVKFAIYCAELVLPLFEGQYKEDNRPRKAIDAAKVWLSSQDSQNVVAAYAAADAANAAAYAAYTANADAAAANAAAAARDAAAAAAAANAAHTAYTANADAAAANAAAAARDAAAAAAAGDYLTHINRTIDYAKTLLKEQYENV